MIEVSRVCRLIEGKGHDRIFVAGLPGSVERYILAVADGLTSENGGIASQWVVDALEQIVGNCDLTGLTARTLFNSISHALGRDQGLPDSHTTLTCGIVSSARQYSQHLHFEFFAVGASP